MFPVLFDLGATRPTTRDVAKTVKAGGTAALTEADRRADEAQYQEVTCRSALNRVKGMPFGWTLNPYRGCTHGCHYCFARRYHTQFAMNAGDDFASVILVKQNFVDVLARELDKPSWTREMVAFGTATDPYQPIEGHYRISRGTIQALTVGRTPFGLITKGPMVVRDIDVLLEHARVARRTVFMSVPTVDEGAWQQLEPGTAHPLQRLRAVRALVDAGINASVLMSPIVPGFSSARGKIERTIKATQWIHVPYAGPEQTTRSSYQLRPDCATPTKEMRNERIQKRPTRSRRHQDQREDQTVSPVGQRDVLRERLTR